MPDNKLDGLSLKELKQLQKDIVRAISTAERKQKTDAREKVDALAAKRGYSLAEFADGRGKQKRAAATPKYRSPDNPALS